MNPAYSYIGIDDTDNLESPGTGSRARELITLLEEQGLGTGIAVTRHQLLVDDRVPYTSHNSSACIVIKRNQGISDDALMDFCRNYLLDIAAEGSDVGLCLAGPDQAESAINFGQKAKIELVQQAEAFTVATDAGIRLEGLTGTHQGVIGALSAVGLHVYGNDGRYLWPRDIRDHEGKTLSMSTLRQTRGIEKISLAGGIEVNDDLAQVALGEWPRTVRINHHAVLLVEPEHAEHHYKVLEKPDIKSIRP